MSSAERIRVEIAFNGGQGLHALVEGATADRIEEAIARGGDGTFTFDAEDGRYSVVLRQVVYVKRFASEGRVGFGV